jgi:hypothetical protein
LCKKDSHSFLNTIHSFLDIIPPITKISNVLTEGERRKNKKYKKKHSWISVNDTPNLGAQCWKNCMQKNAIIESSETTNSVEKNPS